LLSQCIKFLVSINTIEHAVPFAAMTWHTRMTGVLPGFD